MNRKIINLLSGIILASGLIVTAWASPAQNVSVSPQVSVCKYKGGGGGSCTCSGTCFSYGNGCNCG